MIKLTLLHTNDLHGRVQQVVRIAGLVKRIREEVQSEGGACLYLDAGDAEDTTLLESCLTRGSAMDAIMRGAGCDQIALGNAIPIRYGPQAIENLAVHYGKPLLCANLRDDRGELLKGEIPYVFHFIGEFKIAIIGLTDPMQVYGNLFGLNAIQPEEIMPSLIREVRQAGAKVVILLSHLSSPKDIKLAETVSGIDIIIGGHNHQRISPPLEVNHTLIVQAGEYGQVLGRLDLWIEEETGKVIKSKGEMIPVSEELVEDTQVLAVMERERERAHAIMQVPIGELLTPVVHSDEGQCATGNLLADAQLEHTPRAQIALVINGHWSNGLDAGILTQGELYAANRSAGNPGLVELTGAQIEQFLVRALKPENISRKIHPLRGKPIGMPHVAGMRVIVNSNDYSDIQMWIGSHRIQAEERYWVIGSDLEFSEMVGYLPIPDTEVKFEVPTILPEIVEEYIKKILLSPVKMRSGLYLEKSNNKFMKIEVISP